MSYNNQIFLKPTSDPKESEVFINRKYAGRIYDLRGGEFRTERKEIFKKYNGFGVPQVVFEDKQLVFNRVSIYYEREWYTVAKNIFLTHGFSEPYPEGNKLYLSIKYFEQDNHLQLKLPFENLKGD